ncbi:HlyD family type I secretion periplasmic adaptor subunit [Acinetobacter nectaris]|uniref:HlyD family type I secretion periplasmic adaptor subunit n=1 Tax=Acinetobacter nectaris TaxID=1219382 RepID=UPI001F019B19|nr:HlyD family type I secretion periplasmic adaptor subunit [Acinetobacter nectaris]MCF9000080.1 HlyD family type I secretion periplasmic adaptor subunit [Acinetobacter nectaris]MCF9027034.1 HlyD family type I secretion periplasmic adaptor subunit [Acinetobacter nectaris]
MSDDHKNAVQPTSEHQLPSALSAQKTKPFKFKSEQTPRYSIVIWVIALLIIVFVVWAANFKLEEVSTGTGKVVPSSKDQVIQSLDGGVITKLDVKEGDIVEKGQILAQLDPVRFESQVGESRSKLLAAQAKAARLTAEVNGTPLKFPADVMATPNLVHAETALYHSRREDLSQTLSGLTQALSLSQNQLAMTAPLVARGAASEVEVLKIKQDINNFQSQMNDKRNTYYVKAREDLAQANADIQALQQVINGRDDAVKRSIFRAPLHGIVKELDVNTIGGVVPQNGKIMTIVPLDEQLLIEARISPRDIAFIHPDQRALVKITAYDYSIYGGLEGKVVIISPDTIRDEVKQDQFYYRVYIQTNSDKLVNKAGHAFPITPGMVATVDIRTGQKTILEYLLKPFNKAKEALRER